MNDEQFATYKGAYSRGWSAGRRGGGLEAADRRGEHKAWYHGYSDAAVDRPKWSTAHHGSAEAADAALDKGWKPTAPKR